MKSVSILIFFLFALSACSQDPAAEKMAEVQKLERIKALEKELRESSENSLANDLFLAECIETSRATHNRINENLEGFSLEFSTVNAERECRNRAQHQKQEEAAAGRQAERLKRLKELLQSSP